VLISTEGVYGNVKTVLMETLLVDSDENVPQATLQGDLGTESVDFLDIMFRLERQLGIQIPRKELYPESVFRGDPALVQDGAVTDAGIADLRVRMPYADLILFEQDRRLSGMPDLFTIDLLVRYVAWKLGQAAPTPQVNGKSPHLESDLRGR
jgi:acyl carrier protein